MLVVDDERKSEASGGEQFFDMIRLPERPGNSPDGVHCGVWQWRQLVRLLHAGTIAGEPFDLLAIDIRFAKDMTAPEYFNPNEVPLGLVHGLAILAARKDELPLAWRVCSVNAGRIQDDPVAIVCYGLLRALSRTAAPEADDLKSWACAELAKESSVATVDAWPELVERFRREVSRAAERVGNDFGIDETAATATLDRLQNNNLSLGDLGRFGFKFSIRSVEYHLRVSSLFADLLKDLLPEQPIPKEITTKIHDELRKLRALRHRPILVCGRALVAMETLKIFTPLKPWECGGLATNQIKNVVKEPAVRCAILVIAWLRRTRGKDEFDVAALYRECGFPGQRSAAAEMATAAIKATLQQENARALFTHLGKPTNLTASEALTTIRDCSLPQGDRDWILEVATRFIEASKLKSSEPPLGLRL